MFRICAELDRRGRTLRKRPYIDSATSGIEREHIAPTTVTNRPALAGNLGDNLGVFAKLQCANQLRKNNSLIKIARTKVADDADVRRRNRVLQNLVDQVDVRQLRIS